MKKRALNHKNRGEVEQYIKLKKRYDTFTWHHHKTIKGWTAFFATYVTFSEFNRKYKKSVGKMNERKFRSAIKAMKFENRQLI